VSKVVGTGVEWLAARTALLAEEKEVTRRSDELARKRQALPWVPVDKDYSFETEDGTKTLLGLFDGCSQLLVYHFMFGPTVDGWPDAGCPGCSYTAASLDGAVVHLPPRGVMFVAVSSAPLENLLAYRRRMSWSFPWVSQGDSDVNLDFAVFTKEGRRTGTGFNFGTPKHAEEIDLRRDELHGLSAFALEDGVVYHTYSCYDRGTDVLSATWQLLDRKPNGRGDDPAGLAAPTRRIRMIERSAMNLPPVVPETEWQAAQGALRAEEKEATRARDALAAKRRRLPMVRIEKDYIFNGPDDKTSLFDLFEERRQLLLYHFMFGPNQDAGCDGCSMFVDQIGHLAHLHARDTSFALVSHAPITKIEAYRKRMGWTIPWYSSFESDFNVDFGVGPETPQPDVYQDGETFGLSVFVRDGDSVYRTYFTTKRGVEALGSVWTFLDLTPLGRQEAWEDSPAGYPQTKPYEWWRRHDEYEGM